MSDAQSALERAYTNATQLISEAKNALNEAMSLLQPQYVSTHAVVSMPAGMSSFSLPSRPNIAEITVGVIPEIGDAPGYVSISPFNPGVPFPSNSMGAAPVINAPNIAPIAISSFTGSVPALSIPSAPTAPSAFSGSIPSLDSISIPSAPQIVTPNFNGIAPDDPGIDASSISGAFMPAVENISQMMKTNIEGDVDRMILKMNPRYFDQLETLEQKLAELAGGRVATGLSHSVEDAIYERSKSKVDAETSRVQADAWSSAAKRGFTLPTGALMAALQSARQAGADANATSAREIVVMQAEMQQKNIQFALSLSADMRKSIIQAAITTNANSVQMYGQAVQQASAFVDSMMKAASIAVDVFSSKLEAYKAEASVYDALIRASMAEVEIFKAKIDAEKSKADVNMARVGIYKAEVDAHTSQIDAYAKSVDAMAAVAGIEKIKVDAFVATVQAYSAQTQAASASYEAIKAAWGGEESKVRAYAAGAQAYSAQVDGYKAAADAESSRMQAEASLSRAMFEAFSARANAIKGIADAEASRASAMISSQESLVHAYSAESQAIIAHASAEAERYKAESQVAMENGKLMYQQILEQANSNNRAMTSTAEVAVSAGKAYAAVAESAMSGVTTLVSLSEETTVTGSLGTA